MATIFITGITGQDGSYLCDQLLAEGPHVVGLMCPGRASSKPFPQGVERAQWDFNDVVVLRGLLEAHSPAAFYNLAAYSTGAGMYDDPIAIGEFNGIAVARILQSIVDAAVPTRFCQASSSEMFGDPVAVPQTETTAFRPLSPYGAAKLFAHAMVGSYRARHGVFACSAILYNHESPRRSAAFVTQKIARAVARINRRLQSELPLGDLDARRDWGYAPDYVRAMRAMLACDQPGDYVVATGETHSVREFCDAAFSHVGLDYRQHVTVKAEALRHEGRALLVGDATKARTVLGWTPDVDFPTLVKLMVDAELAMIDSRDTTA